MQPSTAHYHPAIRTASIIWDYWCRLKYCTLRFIRKYIPFWVLNRTASQYITYVFGTCVFFFQNLFQMGTRLWRRCCVHKFKFLLVVLVIALFIGEIGCFCLCFVTWRMPQASSDSLNLLFVSDSQIQVSLSCKEALDMRQKSSFTVFGLNALPH